MKRTQDLRRTNVRVGERALENMGVSEGEISECLECFLGQEVIRISLSYGSGDGTESLD